MRSPNRKRAASPTRLLAVVVLTLGLAACASENATADQGKIDACELVSAAEAGEVLGTDVTVKPIDTSAAGPDAASMCSYQTGQIGGGFMLLAGRVPYRDAAAEVADRKKEELSGVPAGIPEPTFTDVTGLGEAAYLAETPESLELHVLDHGAVIVVTLSRKPDTAAETLAEQLARVAVGNLEKNAGQ